eukprot:TRINITY_DN1251_c0_g1_i2.p1 TRINITY_DN1251_c0_g1~~TRINITY_DN1251_c0_g1_i2.p1  ORF type:complete len:277 (+),score=96.94 TRINITY_DN1251_c0_g1_i2:41-832(+)
MNFLKEIVYGSEGVKEREQAKHHHDGAFRVDLKEEKRPVVLEKPVLVEKEIAIIAPVAPSSGHQSVTDELKNLEIREGMQTTESTREPVKTVAVAKETVIREVVHPVEEEIIQPVIHREREQTEVHQITQNIAESEILPTIVEEKTLPAQYIGEFKESNVLAEAEFMKGTVDSSLEVDQVKHIRVVKEPIIEEVIKKTVIEVVQPVIHKETIAPHVIKETLPIYERIVEAPVVINEESTLLVNLGTKMPEPGHSTIRIPENSL